MDYIINIKIDIFKENLFLLTMGAGTQDEHYIQDAAELYWVYKLQELLETNNTAIKNDSHIKKDEFLKYCIDEILL